MPQSKNAALAVGIVRLPFSRYMLTAYDTKLVKLQ